MKLKKAHGTNFRSAEDSGEFSLEQVTSLVGKNEAGKSAILLALAALNCHSSTPAALDKERDYPRRLLTKYGERHPDQDAVAISTIWELTKQELESIAAELGEGVVEQPEVKIRRRYQATEPEWEFDINVQKAIENVLSTNVFEETQIATLQGAKDEGRTDR